MGNTWATTHTAHQYLLQLLLAETEAQKPSTSTTFPQFPIPRVAILPTVPSRNETSSTQFHSQVDCKIYYIQNIQYRKNICFSKTGLNTKIAESLILPTPLRLERIGSSSPLNLTRSLVKHAQLRLRREFQLRRNVTSGLLGDKLESKQTKNC